MPSNEQKRAAAKRKLQRQLERRAERERTGRRLALVSAAVVVLALVGGGVYWWTRPKPEAPQPGADKALTCSFNSSGEPPSKPVNRPSSGPSVIAPPTQDVTLQTDQGAIPLSLDRAKSPCATQSFLSLAEQKYFNDTPCHRLTTEGIYVLQCGDPTGKGTGGPGYSFADEYPSDNNKPVSTTGTTFYTRGTLAMANSGPNTNGSQFFLVYKDSVLQPNYTIFGHIGEAGLSVLDKIAAGGAVSSGQAASDGSPKTPVKITGVDLASAPQAPAPAGPETKP